MDILGLPKRMFAQFEQISGTEKADKASPVKESKTPKIDALSPLSERLDTLARQFDLKALPVSELKDLQTSLLQTGFIGTNQVRAQGLLPQLAYHHYQAGPMNVEDALQEHLQRLTDQPAVLADFNEGKHVLNVVRNLISAREQQTQAA